MRDSSECVCQSFLRYTQTDESTQQPHIIAQGHHSPIHNPRTLLGCFILQQQPRCAREAQQTNERLPTLHCKNRADSGLLPPGVAFSTSADCTLDPHITKTKRLHRSRIRTPRRCRCNQRPLQLRFQIYAFSVITVSRDL